MVEFAIILPVFAMLLFGMITSGLAINEKQQMTFAVREGARFASTVPPDQTFTTGTWASNVRDVIVESSDRVLTTADVCVALVEGSPGTVVTPTNSYSTRPDGGPCIAAQSFPIVSGDRGRRVQVTATRIRPIDWVLGRTNATLNSQATARTEVRG